MQWSTLKIIYGGVIGNSLFIISFFSALTIIPFFKAESVSSATTLIGSIIISLSYIYKKIKIPKEITNFKDNIDYYDHIKKLEKKGALDLIHEFSIIENVKSLNLIPIFNDTTIKLHNFTTIDNYKNILGEQRATYCLTLIKYSFLDNSKKLTRITLTISFIIGILLLYLPASVRIFDFIVRSFINAE